MASAAELRRILAKKRQADLGNEPEAESAATPASPAVKPVTPVLNNSDRGSDSDSQEDVMADIHEELSKLRSQNDELIKLLRGEFPEKLVKLIVASLEPRFAALENKFASSQVAPTFASTLVAATKPAFAGEVLKAISDLDTAFFNASEQSAKVELELIVDSLKGQYPEVSMSQMQEEVVKSVKDLDYLLKAYFADVLKTVVEEAYSGSPAKSIFSFTKRAKADKVKPASSPSTPSGGTRGRLPGKDN